MPRGLAPATSSGRGPVRAEPARGGRQQVRAELGDAVVVVADQDVPQPGPALVAELLELLVVVDDRDRVRVDVEPVAVPSPRASTRCRYGVPIHRARSMPSACGPSVPQCRNASWLVCAPRLSPKTTTRGRGPGRSRSRSQDASATASRFCSRASLTLPSDSGDGRLEYCMRHGGDVAPGQVGAAAATAT